jgi:hypothetical protein
LKVSNVNPRAYSASTVENVEVAEGKNEYIFQKVVDKADALGNRLVRTHDLFGNRPERQSAQRLDSVGTLHRCNDLLAVAGAARRLQLKKPFEQTYPVTFKPRPSISQLLRRLSETAFCGNNVGYDPQELLANPSTVHKMIAQIELFHYIRRIMKPTRLGRI